MQSLAQGGYSHLGMEHLGSLARWVIPEGHPLLRDAFLFRWWHVGLVSVLYTLLIGNIRSLRFDKHPEPVKGLRVLFWVFTIVSVFVFSFVLFEVGAYVLASGSVWSTCHVAPTVQPNKGFVTSSFVPGVLMMDSFVESAQGSWWDFVMDTGPVGARADTGESTATLSQEADAVHQTGKVSPSKCTGSGCGSPKAGRTATKKAKGTKSRSKKKTARPVQAAKAGTKLGTKQAERDATPSADVTRLGFVLWLFHFARAGFDFFVNIQNTLTKPLAELRTTKSVNEVRFSLTHFVMWWLILLYEPGGEVLFSIATVCLFYLGTIACAISQDRLMDMKMGLWVFIVFTHWARHFANVVSGCSFPTALLAVAPPLDINDNMHMMWFYRWGVLPIGFIVCYAMFARGATCGWISMFTVLAWTQFNHSGSKGTLGMAGAPGSDEALKSEGPEDKQAGNAKYHLGQKLLRKCSAVDCHTWETSLRQFHTCQRCRSPYCSRVCQEKDWALYHRLFCRILRKRKLSVISNHMSEESAFDPARGYSWTAGPQPSQPGLTS